MSRHFVFMRPPPRMASIRSKRGRSTSARAVAGDTTVPVAVKAVGGSSLAAFLMLDCGRVGRAEIATVGWRSQPCDPASSSRDSVTACMLQLGAVLCSKVADPVSYIAERASWLHIGQPAYITTL